MADVLINVIGQDSFSGVLGNFGSIMTGIESAVNLAGQAFQAFAGFALQGLDSIAGYERLSLTLESLGARELLATGRADDMATALQMSSGQAQTLLDWMQQVAINSPFTLEGVANAFRMAEAYGFGADEAQRLVQALVDFAAGSGASEDVMQRIALALGQIEAKGHVAGQEILQLVNAGLPALQILADGFGVTTAEMQKMISDGAVPAEKAIEILTEYLETNFAGAAQRQATSWAGLQGTFEDIKQMGLREFFGSLFDVLQPLAIELSNFLQTDGLDRLGEIGAQLGLVAQVFIDLGMVITGFDPKLYDLGTSLQNLGGDSNSILWILGTALRVFQQALDDGSSASDAFGTAMSNLLRNLESAAQGTPFETILNTIENFIHTGQTEGWAVAISDLLNQITTAFVDWMNSLQMNTQIQSALDNLTIMINLWADGGGGDRLAAMLGTIIKDALVVAFGALDATLGDVNFGPFILALLHALMNTLVGAFAGLADAFWTAFAGQLFGESEDQFFAGAQIGAQRIRDWFVDAWYWISQGIGEAFWDGMDALEVNITQWIRDHVLGGWEQIFWDIKVWLRDTFSGIGADIIGGLESGWFATLFDPTGWFRDHVVEPIKTFLGIASPSTVFFTIGTNIVQGLWDGLKSMWDNVRDWFIEKFTNLLQNLTWSNILAVISGQMTIADLFASASSGGTTGGRDMGGTTGGTTSTTLGAATVTNNYYFYGNTYLSGVGPEGTYECTTSPFISTSGGTSPSTTSLGTVAGGL